VKEKLQNFRRKEMKNIKVEGLFREVAYPIRLFDEYGNQIYFKDSKGYSWIREFDENGNYIYFKDSKGIIRDNRPKKKYTVKEIEKLIGINNIEIIKE
jgi:hypothetical protein